MKPSSLSTYLDVTAAISQGSKTRVGTDAQGLALRNAVRILAEMTRNAPAYSVTVQPFGEAHQQACVVLDTLQKLGFEEAK